MYRIERKLDVSLLRRTFFNYRRITKVSVCLVRLAITLIMILICHGIATPSILYMELIQRVTPGFYECKRPGGRNKTNFVR